MQVTASATWWRITAIISATAPLWFKAIGYTLYAESFLVPILLVGAAALVWFAWSGLAIAWLSVWSCFASRPQPRPQLSAAAARPARSHRAALEG